MVAKVTAVTNAAQAAHYHNHDDYYFKEKGPSIWSGKTAERLGLAGQQVDHKIFSQLLAGKIPTILPAQSHQEKQADGRNYFQHTAEPHLEHLKGAAPNGLRKLSECRLAHYGSQETARVLQSDARFDGREPDSLRREPDVGQQQLALAIQAQIHRGGGKQRPGVDLTFSAPRSFSIAALAGGRPDLVALFDQAVNDTLAEVEKQAGCRVTQDKQTREVMTGNYLFAQFNHSTSRPVTQAQIDGLGSDYADLAKSLRESGGKYLIDPNLHKHVLVMNMTWCEETQSYKAIDNHPLFDNQMLIGAMFHARLAELCREAGYDLRDFGDNGEFELAGIDQAVVDKFSLRSALIEQELASMGLTRDTATAKQKDIAAKRTRNAKDHGIERAELHGDWQKRIADLERSLDVNIRELATNPNAGAADSGSGPATAREGIESGLRHFMERSSIVKEAEVIRWAISKSRGFYSIKDVQKALEEMKASGELVAGEVKKDSSSPGAAKASLAFEEAEATAAMLKLMAKVSAKQGIEAAKSKKFVDVRNWLDTHSPRRLGLKDSNASQATETRPGDVVLTTRAAQERERVMLARVRAGKGALPAILAPQIARDRLNARDTTMKREAYAKAIQAGKSEAEAVRIAAGTGLNSGQRAAAELILSTRDRVVCIQGVAGAGKTFMLDQVVKEAVIAEAGRRGIEVVGLAPSHQAKNELINVTGDGSTLQSFLTNPKKWKEYGPHHLFVVDEAGMASTQQLSELLRVAEQQGFRVALVGDTRQFKAVDAGNPLVQVQQVAATAHMSTSVRHKTEDLVKAAELAAEGKMAEALERLGSVKEIQSDSERRQAIADRFTDIGQEAEKAALLEGKDVATAKQIGEKARKETLLLTGTNEARKEINAMVRTRLGLAGKGVEMATLHNKDTTEESRRFLAIYKVGDVLQFARQYASLGVKAGERLTVAEIQNDRIILTDGNRKIDFYPARLDTKQWGVYEADTIELTAGDRVRMRENSREHGFFNGDWGRVIELDGQTVVIESERDQRRWTINHADRAIILDHGYAMTGNSAQGATVDRVLADFDTKSRTMNMEAAYTDITRARYGVEIYTDNEKRLPSVISKAVEKHNALDFDRITKQKEQERAQERETASELEI